MAKTIIAVMEQQQGRWNRMSWESLAAAQQIGDSLGAPVEAMVIGAGVRPLADEVAVTQVASVRVLNDVLLEPYTPDAYCAALQQFILTEQPQYVILPHTYQVRDFAPKLAASLGRSLLSDCIAYRVEEGKLVFTRQLFQGKMNADISFDGDPPYFVSVQAGSFSADKVVNGEAHAPATPFTVKIEAANVRTKPLEKFQESERTLDLTQAEIIVAVGRGIKEQEKSGFGPGTGRVAGCRGGRLAAHLRQRLASDGAPDWQLRSNRDTETLRCTGHLRSHPAHGGHEGFAHGSGY